jgi:lipopolysaccharide transport system ATP-binding protein
MSDLALRTDNLWKVYRLGAGPSLGLRETVTAGLQSLSRALRHPFRKSPPDPTSREFAALQGVTLEVKCGESLGIIGRNGSGKSTLLKILSRITEPTRGRAVIEGRVGSLLEVGSGFHRELSGRENVYLNGAILGMKRREIQQKFDEIVAFAELADFIDVPVKRYSSGMYTRLTFAVAAHLDPDILIVDEVLAVGDAAFQKKCLQRLSEVRGQGRTVLFVSHSASAVTRLCTRTVLMEHGQIIADGPPEQVMQKYLHQSVGSTAERCWDDPATAPGNEVVRLRAVRIRDDAGRITAQLDIRRPIRFEMDYEVTRQGQVLCPLFQVYNDEGCCLFVAPDTSAEWRGRPRPTGLYSTSATLPGNFLAEGFLIVQASVWTFMPPQLHAHEPYAAAFSVVDTLDGDSARGDYGGHMPGVVRPMLQWATEFDARSRSNAA